MGNFEDFVSLLAASRAFGASGGGGAAGAAGAAEAGLVHAEEDADATEPDR